MSEQGLSQWGKALFYYSDLTLLQAFQPMAAQLSKKAELPLAKILATVPCRSSKTGPSWAIDCKGAKVTSYSARRVNLYPSMYRKISRDTIYLGRERLIKPLIILADEMNSGVIGCCPSVEVEREHSNCQHPSVHPPVRSEFSINVFLNCLQTSEMIRFSAPCLNIWPHGCLKWANSLPTVTGSKWVQSEVYGHDVKIMLVQFINWLQTMHVCTLGDNS